MSSDLTNRQAEIYEYIERFICDQSMSPTLIEIRDHFGFSSSSSVQNHLKLIERKGFIKRERGRARSIRILRPGNISETAPSTSVPLVGRIAAGVPIFALEHIEDYLALPDQLFHGCKLFALRVMGDSMIGVGILDGDIAVLKAQPDCDSGQIAAVVFEEEATLKRVFKTSAGICLKAENEKYPDRLIESTNSHALRIAGVMAGLIRQTR